MINRILMELYDDYIETNSIKKLTDFARITFADQDAQNFFIGIVTIAYFDGWGTKPRYNVTSEKVLEIAYTAKENIEGTNINLLQYYLDNINTYKYVNKYFNKIKTKEDFDKAADIIISYFEQFKNRFKKSIISHYIIQSKKKNNN